MEAVRPGEDATTMTDSNTSAERNFFRIDDEVRLNWTRVDPDAVRTDTDRETELIELNVYLHDLISTAFGDSAVVGEQGNTPRLGASLNIDRHGTSHLYQLGSDTNPFH